MIIYLLLMKIILKDHKFLESANDDGENTKLLLDQLQHSITPRNYHLHCGNRFLSKNNTNLLKVKLHITHDPTLPLYSYD